MLLEPLTEGSSVDLNDTVLYQCLCADKFVVGCIVDDIYNTGFAGDRFGGPGKISSFKTQSTLFDVSSTDTDQMDTLGTQLGVGWLTSELKLSLLSVVSAFCSSV